MSFFSTISEAWRLTSEGSRALTAAHEAYSAGASIPGIISAWATATESTVDDSLAADLTGWLTEGISIAHSTAVTLVKVTVRLDVMVPDLVSRFSAVVDWVEDSVPPLIEKMRTAADVANREADQVRSWVQSASREIAYLAGKLEQLRGDASGGH